MPVTVKVGSQEADVQQAMWQLLPDQPGVRISFRYYLSPDGNKTAVVAGGKVKKIIKRKDAFD